MQNPIQNFRQSSVVFEKPGILSENLKTFDELQLPYSSIFLAETSHTFSTYQCPQKGVGFLSYLQKLKKQLQIVVICKGDCSYGSRYIGGTRRNAKVK